MTKFTIHVVSGHKAPLFGMFKKQNTTTKHVVYGEGYSISSHSPGIERIVIYNADNRHLFTANWDKVECVYMNDKKL